MKKFLLFSVLLLLFIVSLNANAYADTFVTGIPNTGNQDWSGSLGDSFTVGSMDLLMTDVGVFDSDMDGLQSEITFQLWTGGSGTVGSRTLLHEEVFAIGDGTLDVNHRYKSLTSSILLDAGASYTVVAYGYGLEKNYNENFDGVQVAFSTTGLSPGVGGYSASGGVDPDLFIWAPTPPFNLGDNFGVASFKYDSVPEPATMLLLGSGILGLTCFRRRFRKA